MSFRVRLTGDAEADFERRLAALAGRSPEGARRLNDRFEEALLRLRDFPLSCGLAYEDPVFVEEIRPLPLRHPPEATLSGPLHRQGR